MLFKDVKIGQSVYVLSRTGLTLDEVKVTQVSLPHADITSGNYNKMFVDVTTQGADGSKCQYTVGDGVDVAYASDKILSVTRQGLLSDVESIRMQAQQSIDSIDHYRQIVVNADKLLAELNPEVKEKQETEKRFSNIESSLSDLKELMTKFINQKV